MVKLDLDTAWHPSFNNFYHSPFVFEGRKWQTAEHAFQALKTWDPGEQDVIRYALTPGHAKVLGRRVKLRDNWEGVKYWIMLDIIRHKFIFDTQLGRALMKTGTQKIVEWNNWHDRVWGKCVCDDCEGKGKNLLGKALMQHRARLIQTAKELKALFIVQKTERDSLINFVCTQEYDDANWFDLNKPLEKKNDRRRKKAPHRKTSGTNRTRRSTQPKRAR